MTTNGKKKWMAAGLAALMFLGQSAFAADAPVTFSVLSLDTNPNWADMKDEVGKAITAKTGVSLKMEYPVGSPDQKLALVAASGEYPDLIMPKGGTAQLVDAGVLLELSGLIDKYAPNIKRILGDQMKRLRYSSTNKSIYIIPSLQGIGSVTFDTHALFNLQLDALKEANYPKVETLQDYEKVIADYVKKHPTTADGKPTIGLSLLADDWRIVISVTNPAVYATGLRDDGEWYIDPKTLKAKEHYFRPEEREYFRWLNHMSAVGLLDKESFIQKLDQYNAKVAQGRVVGLIDADWDFDPGTKSLKANNLFGKAYGHFGVTVKKGTLPAYNQPTGFTGGWGIGITTKCKDPVRAIKFLDWLASDEGQILVNWGIEGKHYKIVNGKRVIPDDVMQAKTNDANSFSRKTGIGSYLISLRYGDGVKDATGSYYTTVFPESVLTGYSAADREALKAYKATFWGDLLPTPDKFPTVPWGVAWTITLPEDSPLSEFWDREQSVVRKRIPEMILAKPAQFDKLYDAFLVELDAATGKLAELETALIKDRIALWSE